MTSTTHQWVVIPGEGSDAYLYDCDGGTLAALQALVGGNVDCVDIGRDVDMWVNDEGLLLGMPLNLGASLLARRPIYGAAVLAGHDDAGNTTSLPDEEDLRGLVGEQLSDAAAVNLMVEAMEMSSIFQMVRGIADVTRQDPRKVLGDLVSGDLSSKLNGQGNNVPTASAGNVRYVHNGYL